MTTTAEPTTTSDMFRGTSTRDEPTDAPAGSRELTKEQLEAVAKANALVKEAYELLNSTGVFTTPMPVGHVQWLPISQVEANDYNPNAVARQEMHLLHTSISADGYTQPVVAVWDEDRQKAVIVDGYHRYTTMRRYADVFDSTGGMLPVVIIDKPIEDRIASTVRHNRARGKHSMQGMGSLVFQMLEAGEDDVTICHKLGLEAEEIARLKHITGYSKLYANVEYGKASLSRPQMTEKANYKKEHPDEHVPQF